MLKSEQPAGVDADGSLLFSFGIFFFVVIMYSSFSLQTLLVASRLTGETDGNNKSSSPAHQEAILAFCLFTLFIYLLTFM